MNTGIALWNLESDNYGEKINRVIEFGFNSISFLGTSFEGERAGRIGEIIKKNGLKITFHLSFFGMNKDKLIEGLDKRLTDIDKFLNGQDIRENLLDVCFDPAFSELPKKIGIEFDLESTAGALKYALDWNKDINIGIENWLINSKISELNKIKKAVNNKRLGMLLDIGHMHVAVTQKIVETEDVNEYLSSLPFEIYEFHIHDNDGVTDSHLPLGRGNMDYGAVFNSIKKNCKFDKNGVLTVELKPQRKTINLKDEEKVNEVIKTRKILESYFN